ncbi:MAG: thioredoxin family protein [Peptococcaceae bacterium]
MNKKGYVLILIIFLVVAGYKFIYQEKNAARELQPADHAEAALNAALDNEKPTFIEFTSDNCPACRKAKPWIEEMYQDYGDKVNFILVDVDKNGQTLARQMGVTAVPSFIYFDKEAEIIDAFAGYPVTDSKEYLEDKIKAMVE